MLLYLCCWSYISCAVSNNLSIIFTGNIDHILLYIYMIYTCTVTQLFWSHSLFIYVIQTLSSIHYISGKMVHRSPFQHFLFSVQRSEMMNLIKYLQFPFLPITLTRILIQMSYFVHCFYLFHYFSLPTENSSSWVTAIYIQKLRRWTFSCLLHILIFSLSVAFIILT